MYFFKLFITNLHKTKNLRVSFIVYKKVKDKQTLSTPEFQKCKKNKKNRCLNQFVLSSTKEGALSYDAEQCTMMPTQWVKQWCMNIQYYAH